MAAAHFHVMLPQQVLWKPAACRRIHTNSRVDISGSLCLQHRDYYVKSSEKHGTPLHYSSRCNNDNLQPLTIVSVLSSPVTSSSLCRIFGFGEPACQKSARACATQEHESRHTGIWPHCTIEQLSFPTGQHRYEQFMVRHTHTPKAFVYLLWD